MDICVILQHGIVQLIFNFERRLFYRVNWIWIKAADNWFSFFHFSLLNIFCIEVPGPMDYNESNDPSNYYMKYCSLLEQILFDKTKHRYKYYSHAILFTPKKLQYPRKPLLYRNSFENVQTTVHVILYQ